MSRINEVPQPIICDAYAEPTHHWVIERGVPPVKAEGRREACYYYRPNAEGSHGRWAYRLVKSPADVPEALRSAAEELATVSLAAR